MATTRHSVLLRGLVNAFAEHVIDGYDDVARHALAKRDLLSAQQNSKHLELLKNVNPDDFINITRGSFYTYGPSYIPYMSTFGDLFNVISDTLGNTIGPALAGLMGIAFLFIVMGIITAVVGFLTYPRRAFLGLRTPVLRRFVVRLISAYGQEFINKFQASFPLIGNLQVPAPGFQISRPVVDNVPGFTVDVPATTIKYNYNLSASATAKLQALIDTFNDLFRIRGASGVIARSLDDENNNKNEKLHEIVAEIRELIGDKCHDFNAGTSSDSMEEAFDELCRKINHVLKMAESLENLDST